MVDTALPFGLRSAPKIFSAVADALLWVMCQEGVQSALHYLDDFLFVGAPESDECKVALGVAQGVCQWLGAPLALEKREGPARILPFLGIVLDTEKLELRLPEEKLQRLRELIRQWQGKKSCRKRELLSVIGQLQHACRVVKPVRTFLRRMIELSTTAHELYHHIRLNRGFQSDLEWWALFLSEWNGVGMMVAAGRATPQVVLTSDASGMRRLFLSRGVVSMPVAKCLGRGAHHGKGTSANSDGVCHVGAAVARKDHSVPIRQRSSGGDHQLGVQ